MKAPPRLGSHVCRTPEPPRLPRLPGHLRAQLAHLSSRRPPRRRPGRPSRPRLARRQRHRRRRRFAPRRTHRLARPHLGDLRLVARRNAPAGGGEDLVVVTEAIRVCSCGEWLGNGFVYQRAMTIGSRSYSRSRSAPSRHSVSGRLARSAPPRTAAPPHPAFGVRRR